GASDTGPGTGNLRCLRDPAGHAAALVTEIAGKRGGMAMQAGALPAGAEMRDAIGHDEIPRIEQRSFAHSCGYRVVEVNQVPGWASVRQGAVGRLFPAPAFPTPAGRPIRDLRRSPPPRRGVQP